MIPSRSVLSALGTVLAATLVIVACGSSDESKFGDGVDAGTGFGDGAAFGEGGNGIDSGDLYANDPLPKWCGPDGGAAAPPQPGGTEQCPDDKNKPGCGCNVPGQTAACWTGLRANRKLGVCKDGVTTCQQVTETTYAWGPCEGQVLPSPGVTKGKAACKCFSEGQWKINNLSPCFVYFGQTQDATNTYGVATFVDPADGNKAKCPCTGPDCAQPPVPKTGVWSQNSLNVDCAGRFKLCYELKAGKFDDPKATDCSIAKVCTEGDYPKEGVDTPFPDLPSWSSTNTACNYKWDTEGGYGEMTVVGLSVRCDAIDDGNGQPYVFNRVKYCPAKCRNGQNPNDPECQGCQQGGSGTF